MPSRKPIAQRLAALACVLVLALSGCGGSVAVHSNPSAGATGAASGPSAAPGTGGQGLHAAFGSNLWLVVFAGLVVAEVVHWTHSKLKASFGPEQAPAAEPAPPAVRKCVHPVAAMC